jgi:hypothetical protein
LHAIGRQRWTTENGLGLTREDSEGITMPMSAKDIESLIKTALPDAVVALTALAP